MEKLRVNLPYYPFVERLADEIVEAHEWYIRESIKMLEEKEEC
jgi:hypothetical protein